MPPVSFDRVAGCYDATRAIPADALAAVTAGIRRALREVAAAPRLLEIGIGTGRIAVPLAELGIDVTGIDVAPAMLGHLRAKRPMLPVAIADANALPFPAGAFDGVLFVHVLHLVPDAGAVLSAAHEIVRPGGLLLYGRTNATGPRREAVALARAVAGELLGMELGPRLWNAVADEAFAEHARRTGAQTTETVLARWTDWNTGRDFLDAVSRRIYSSTWVIPEAVMPDLIRTLTPRLEAKLGGLDQPVANETTFVLLTARRPTTRATPTHTVR